MTNQPQGAPELLQLLELLGLLFPCLLLPLTLSLFMARIDTTTLYRPVGPEELELIKQSNWSAFPPRLPEQPIFYPVLTEEYAQQIARDWNVRASGAGFVTKFEVESNYLSRFNVQVVGGSEHTEYWIPAEELAEFNRHIVGNIEVIAEFQGHKD